MILSLGLLFDGCVMSSQFVVGKEVEDEAIVGDEVGLKGDCDEVEDDEEGLNNQAWLWFGQSMHQEILSTQKCLSKQGKVVIIMQQVQDCRKEENSAKTRDPTETVR